jgi:pimeloyl-ACP methyl ester carboxylesterase
MLFKTILLKTFLCTILVCSTFACAEHPATRPASDSLAELEAKALYFPRSYEQSDIDDFVHDGGVRLNYKTSQGNQTAWLILPEKNAKPQRLWMVCGGNGVLALEMASFCRETGLKSDAFLLVDYPSYGLCEGKPSPETVRENVKDALLAAARPTGIDVQKNPELVCVFGHSLGCAAALLAATEFHLKSAVLCSPFTSTHEMAELKTGLAKDAPFYQQFDNRVGLKALRDNKGTAWIIHGEDDALIPVTMSKTMADEFKDVVKLQAIPGAGHNDILIAARKQIVQAMQEARKPD